MIWWNDFYPNPMPEGESYVPYLLPMPYTLLISSKVDDSGEHDYGYGSVTKCMNKEAYSGEEMPNGYLIPLPTMNNAFNNCGFTSRAAGSTDEELANSMLNSFWGSAFCKHWYPEATWDHPFWQSFGFKQPDTSWSKTPKGLLMSILQKWSETPLEEIMKKDFGTRQLSTVLR